MPTASELFEAKRNAEADIRSFLAGRMQRFLDETGFCISGVDISLCSVANLSTERSEYIVGNVRIELDL